VLLYQRRFGDAAEEAALIDADSPLLAMAVRSELFGRICDGQLDRVEAVLARGATARMPRAELDLFEQWARLEGGLEASKTLALPAIGLAGAVLESLLRVECFKAFERLVGLLRASALPEREQRELLATIYLRRGFLASAAQEWMTVCNGVADVRALIGLARIARAQGLAEDVAVFAAKALELDPDHPEARRLAGAVAEPERAAA
jgi:hypothetical protein